MQKSLPITELVTVGPVVAINPNTAPDQVLQSLPGISPAIARAIIERRKLGIVSVDLIDSLAGGGLAQIPPRVIAFPADTVRVTQSAPGLPWAQRYNMRLTPRDPVAPWQTVYFHRLEQPTGPPSAASSPDIARLPPRLVLPSSPTVAAPP